MSLVLVNPDVAAKYEATFKDDQSVTLPGTYAGMLSNITIEAADLLMKQKSNLLKPKTSAAPVKATDNGVKTT